jgi:hypothetical protein
VMSQAAGAALRAEDLPAGADAASGEPGLAALFADYDQYGSTAAIPLSCNQFFGYHREPSPATSQS